MSTVAKSHILKSRGARIVISVIVLFVAILVYSYVLTSDSLRRYAPLWMVFCVLPTLLLLQFDLLKAFKKDGVSPVVKDLNRTKAFVLAAGAMFLGTKMSSLVIHKRFPDLNVEPFTIVLFSLALLFFVRAGLLKLVAAILPERRWSVVSGYTDFFLILLNGEALALKSPSSNFRLTIVVLAIASLRLAWGYIPEDRFMVLREFIQFLGERKLWWMAPIFIVMALLMALVMLTQTTGGSFPFIYAVF